MVLKPRDMEVFDSEKIGMQPSKMVFFSHQTWFFVISKHDDTMGIFLKDIPSFVCSMAGTRTLSVTLGHPLENHGATTQRGGFFPLGWSWDDVPKNVGFDFQVLHGIGIQKSYTAKISSVPEANRLSQQNKLIPGFWPVGARWSAGWWSSGPIIPIPRPLLRPNHSLQRWIEILAANWGTAGISFNKEGLKVLLFTEKKRVDSWKESRT